MSITQSASGPIQSRDDLVRQLSKGSRPKAQWRIGTEHEKFVFNLADHSPVPYAGPNGIRALLEGMQRFDWQAIGPRARSASQCRPPRLRRSGLCVLRDFGPGRGDLHSR